MKRFLVAVALLLCLLSACGDGDSGSTPAQSSGCTPRTCLVYVVYSMAGLGDQGFEDLIYYGVNRAQYSYNYMLENAYPDSVQTPEKLIGRFFDEKDSGDFRQRLLILTVGDFDSIVMAHKEWKQDSVNSVLIFESRKDSLDAYFWDISLYGSSYLAGRAVKAMGLDSAVIIAANDKTPAVMEAVKGFTDGFRKGGGSLDSNNGSVVFLSHEEGGGFDSEATYFETSFLSALGFDFVFPVMGGSNLNLFRYLREYKDSVDLLTCGMDVDQQAYSDRIAFSVDKRVDSLAIRFLERWSSQDSLERDFLGLLDSDLEGIVVADGYSDWQPVFDKFKAEAIDAERDYVGKNE